MTFGGYFENVPFELKTYVATFLIFGLLFVIFGLHYIQTSGHTRGGKTFYNIGPSVQMTYAELLSSDGNVPSSVQITSLVVGSSGLKWKTKS